jgi:hypothetical protein
VLTSNKPQISKTPANKKGFGCFLDRISGLNENCSTRHPLNKIVRQQLNAPGDGLFPDYYSGNQLDRLSLVQVSCLLPFQVKSSYHSQRSLLVTLLPTCREKNP